jgi:hypothetical protein
MVPPDLCLQQLQQQQQRTLAPPETSSLKSADSEK